MNLFLDTNIYLSFYKFSGDDLEELRKLIVAVREGPTNLVLTQQIVEEFDRNREGAIAESLSSLEKADIPKGFPRLFTSYPEFAEMQDALTNYESNRAALLSQGRSDADARTLHADRLIDELFGVVTKIDREPETVARAQSRVAVGNPPGKGGSLGDAINWETLLSSVPDGEELLLVSADSDFASSLDPTRLDAFLAAEWRSAKRSVVEFHRSLNSLFRSRYSDIRLAAELERELAVGRLLASGAFSTTHLAINDLMQFADFTPAQVELLVEAPSRNNQIGWILGDADVQEFFGRLLDRYGSSLRDEQVQSLRADLDSAAEFWRVEDSSSTT
jgi:hypothetical protein